MNIYLISPKQYGTSKTPRALHIPQIALQYLRALTPSKHHVRAIEEGGEPVDFDYDCDLVGLSVMTATAIRAYQIAREFKRRGKTVVMGGIHPSVLPDEALKYADAVVIGEAEGVWARLLEDAEKGSLKRTYRHPEPDLSAYPLPLRDDVKRYTLYKAAPVVTSRGCPFNCEFCSVHEVFGRKLRHVPVEMVVRDIENTGTHNIVFLDDNIMGRREYSKQLFKAIAPLKKRWVGQASISFVKDDELMDLALESGCGALFIGFETVSEEKMKTMPKMYRSISDTEKAIHKLQRNGIFVNASMVLGFDDDPESVFEDTLDFLVRNNIGSVSFNILTPYPGTEVYRRLEREGRLLTRDWRWYDHCTLTYRTKNMTPGEFTKKFEDMVKRFYSYPSILKRLPDNRHHPLFFMAINMAKHWKSRKMGVATVERADELGEGPNDDVGGIVDGLDPIS